MDKKHISIIGTCCSRNLFNTSLLRDVFNIDFYACQICPFALFDKGLNIDKNELYKANIEEFIARMFWYELNKVAINEAEKQNSEYLLIDLHNIYSEIGVVQYNNQFVYTQSTGNNIKNRINFLYEIESLKSITFKPIKIQNIAETIIYNGLNKLADWAKSRFDSKKIIIYIPQLAQTFYDLDNNFSKFNDSIIDRGKCEYELVKKFSIYLHNRIKGSVLLEDNFNKIAGFINYDEVINCKTPYPNHFIEPNYFKTSKNLLELLKIDYKDYYIQPIEAMEYEVVKAQNLAIKINKDLQFAINHCLNLNQYIDKLDLENDIIIFSVCDEGSSKLKFFRNRKNLKLNFNFGYRDSYIGIISNEDNILYEETSQDKIVYSFSIKDNKFEICSANYLVGNISYVSLNGKKYYSKKRGLNIFVFKRKTFELVDVANCDTHIDKYLLINSDKLNNIVI